MEKQLILRKIMDESGYLVVQESKEVLQNSFKKERKKKKKKTERKEGEKIKRHLNHGYYCILMAYRSKLKELSIVDT